MFLFYLLSIIILSDQYCLSSFLLHCVHVGGPLSICSLYDKEADTKWQIVLIR